MLPSALERKGILIRRLLGLEAACSQTGECLCLSGELLEPESSPPPFSFPS